MRKTILTLIHAVLLLGLTGCATIPDKSEMTQLGRSVIESEVVGNTLTYRADQGRRTEYFELATTGYGRALGQRRQRERDPDQHDLPDRGVVLVHLGEPEPEPEPECAGPDKE